MNREELIDLLDGVLIRHMQGIDVDDRCCGRKVLDAISEAGGAVIVPSEPPSNDTWDESDRRWFCQLPLGGPAEVFVNVLEP